MDNMRVVVGIVERVAELAHPIGQFCSLKDSLLLIAAQSRKGLAIDIFHRNATGAVVVDEIVNSHDMGMSEFQAALGLALELINHRAILNHQIREKLKSDLAL